ncbi:MAG: hypothetical protein M3119_06595 [Verrucomicrobiota bacterium]|nr:hypothetical protein [Verrucomicrobiota bacterium]MDQ6939810.1 hypothetical protein [Verrucomicrobiota bacterium]
MPGYRIAPIFLIRAAGVPFDHLERLATPRATAAARELLVRQREFADAKANVELLLRTRDHGLSDELFAGWRKAIRAGAVPAATDQTSGAFAVCWECAQKQALAEANFKNVFENDFSQARRSLLQSSKTELAPYLVFGAGEFRDRLREIANLDLSGDLPPRNTRARERERHLLLYLQRICGKNDTFSRFGPSAWGSISAKGEGLSFAADAPISARSSFLERWTAHAVAAAVNLDAEARLEVAPRLNPTGRLEENAFFLTETNERFLLDGETLRALAVCDGQKPAHEISLTPERLQFLARQGIIRWQLEVPALEPLAFDRLLAEVRAWRDNSVRARWLELLEPLEQSAEKFCLTSDVSQRLALMNGARDRLTSLGSVQKGSQRALYTAANPVAEECFQDSRTILSEAMAEQFARDAEPWIDLWRDTYAYVASRVSAGLRDLLASTPKQDGVVPLPAFLRHCANNQLPLTAHGTIVFAHKAFQEIKAAFREQIDSRGELEEVELTAEDCHLVRRNFEYPKFDEYTFPSADLQISASSSAAIARNEYQWVLAELHPPLALIHHCFFWSCPDRSALSRALESTMNGRPHFHFGVTAADLTAHTTVRIFDALPDLTHFISAQKGLPSYQTIPPAEAEVYVDETSGDVCLRQRETKKFLGSFARAWLIPLGFHPFHFGRPQHMPRLRCGSVIVQRRAWTVHLGELAPGNYSGVSRDLILAVERLRAEKQWPRYIYVRPTEQALRRSGGEGRDKDTKPIYIDLESYLSLEIFHRWLTKSGELEVTEMLPDPDHLCWEESGGRRTFELRTLIVPRT